MGYGFGELIATLFGAHGSEARVDTEAWGNALLGQHKGTPSFTHSKVRSIWADLRVSDQVVIVQLWIVQHLTFHGARALIIDSLTCSKLGVHT